MSRPSDDQHIISDVGVKKSKAMQDVGAIYGIPELHEMRLADFSELDHRIFELAKKVPKLPAPWQYVCALLNVFIPGTGTMLSTIWAEPCSKTQLAIGLCQFFSTMILIGWIWSVVWACMLVSTANESGDIVSLLNQATARSDDPAPHPGQMGAQTSNPQGVAPAQKRSVQDANVYQAQAPQNWDKGYMVG